MCYGRFELWYITDSVDERLVEREKESAFARSETTQNVSSVFFTAYSKEGPVTREKSIWAELAFVLERGGRENFREVPLVLESREGVRLR